MTKTFQVCADSQSLNANATPNVPLQLGRGYHHTSRENNYKSQRNQKRAFSTMADKFYGSSRRPLGLVNRVGEGNRQKKRRTEDLDLSAVIRIASETTAPGHKGGSKWWLDR